MKRKSIHVDPLIYEAARKRLAEAGWNNIDYACEYFLAECVVRKKLPAFMNLNTKRSCAVCKFYEPIHAEQWKRKLAEFQKKAKEGTTFTALLHPTREGGYWCEIPAFCGCCSQGSTLAEAKYMIKDAALGWLDVEDVNLRFRVVREKEEQSDLMMFNTPDAARAFLKDNEKSTPTACAQPVPTPLPQHSKP